MSDLILVTPYGSPGSNGVGDQVRLITKALLLDDCLAIKQIGIASRREDVSVEDRIFLREDTKGVNDAVIELIRPGCVVVVHYVCYGYQRRGCPVSFIRTLRMLRSRIDFKLITVFHELAAKGPIFSSTFFVAPLQIYLINALARLSDEVATSTPLYARHLETITSHSIDIHPVISNIGEPDHPGPLIDRDNTAVVFGLPPSRKRLFNSSLFAETVHRLGISSVVEVGRPVGISRPDLPNIDWVSRGELEAVEVSKVLLSSRFAIFLYDAKRLTKSGIYAAFAAHRVVPVLIPESASEFDGLGPNVDYLDATRINTWIDVELQDIADHAWNWYKTNRSLAICKDLYLKWIAAHRTPTA